MPEFEIEDLGWASFTIGGVTNQVDLYRARNQLTDLWEKYKGKPDEDYNQGILDLLQSYGFPSVSQYVAVRFVDRINEAVQMLANRARPTPGLPASTGSTPSN